MIMKKLKLRKWVKETLFIGILLIISGIILSMAAEYHDREIINCVEAGNSYNFCEKGLR